MKAHKASVKGDLTDIFYTKYNCNVYIVTDQTNVFITQVFFCSRDRDIGNSYSVSLIPSKRVRISELRSRDTAIRNAIKQTMGYE